MRLLIVHSRWLDGPNVLIEVTDTGTGIDPDKLERIFEPFVTSKRDGLGMGLAICRSIIDRHGGKIWAENNPDGGMATFSITLPAAIASKADRTVDAFSLKSDVVELSTP